MEDEEFQEVLVRATMENPELKGLGIFDKESGPIKSTENYLYNRYRQAAENDADSSIIDVDFVPEESPDSN